MDANLLNLVINQFEGGYYHPDMLQDGRVTDQRYKYSGETMFGIDRKYTPAPAFWAIIDNANARKLWKWNYFGGTLEATLKQAAFNIIMPLYAQYTKDYLSAKSQLIVASDPRLEFNFIYATWNGPKWFQKFATDLNAAVASGITNPDELVKVCLNSRTKEGSTKGSDPNSLIVQTGTKMAALFGSNTYAAIFKKKAQTQPDSTGSLELQCSQCAQPITLTITLS